MEISKQIERVKDRLIECCKVGQNLSEEERAERFAALERIGVGVEKEALELLSLAYTGPGVLLQVLQNWNDTPAGAVTPPLQVCHRLNRRES